jgi:hypothetical protein
VEAEVEDFIPPEVPILHMVPAEVRVLDRVAWVVDLMDIHTSREVLVAVHPLIMLDRVTFRVEAEADIQGVVV